MRIPHRAAIDSLDSVYLASRSAFRLTCALSVAAVTWLVSQLAFAQSDAFTVPLTPDGVPDLQGIWTSNTITPLERDPRFGDTLVLSREQAMELERAVAEYSATADAPSDPNRGAPDKGTIELADSYNNFWFDDGTRVAEYNGEYRSSLISAPSNGRIPAYTPAAQSRIDTAMAQRTEMGAYAGPEARPLAERCLLSFSSSGGPPMLPILYNNHYQIVQSSGYVMILVEMVHDARIIRIDRGSLPENHQRWLGDSVGHWEDDTLVVTTSKFNPSQRFRNSSENFKIIERFTRVGEDRINYEFTVHDPDTWVEEWSAQIPMNRTDEKMYEYACHEGNYSLPGVLAGARRDEATAPK